MTDTRPAFLCQILLENWWVGSAQVNVGPWGGRRRQVGGGSQHTEVNGDNSLHKAIEWQCRHAKLERSLYATRLQNNSFLQYLHPIPLTDSPVRHNTEDIAQCSEQRQTPSLSKPRGPNCHCHRNSPSVARIFAPQCTPLASMTPPPPLRYL